LPNPFSELQSDKIHKNMICYCTIIQYPGTKFSIARPLRSVVNLSMDSRYPLPVCVLVLGTKFSPRHVASLPVNFVARMAEPAEQEDPLHTPRAESLRRTLTAYYTTHGPENLPNVEALVGRVVGGPPSEVGGMVVGGVLWSEEELFEKIEAKYGVKVQIRRGRNYPPALSASVIFHKDSPYSAEWGEAEWPYDSFRV
jgi:hypothetical protein